MELSSLRVLVVGGAGYIGSHMVKHLQSADVRRFIFSSTAAIFGEPEQALINEAHPKRPINPYGRTKLMVEEALADYD
jgi:UDP-glucose 4-epimerase